MVDALIRPATPGDLPALVEIQNHFVLHSHATFATTPYGVAEREPWFSTYGTGRHQLLVAERSGAVAGYTCSSPYRPTPAFETTVELSIYLHPTRRCRGLGTALYTALLERLGAQDVHLAVAGIALPNEASVALHRRLGFVEVGTFREYARKNGAWISSIWFQRPIG